MGLLLQLFGYGLKNSVHISQNIIVPEAKHPIASCLQKGRSRVSLAACVLAAIHFDNQLVIATQKIADVWPNRHLA